MFSTVVDPTNERLELLCGCMPGVTGTTSVDFDLRRELADAALPFGTSPVTRPGVFLTVGGSSTTIDNSSGASFGSSRMGDTVLVTLLLFSIERTFSTRSGLSSSSSAVPSGTGCDEPRFLFPNCGVTALFLGVPLRCALALRGAERLRCRFAEPFTLRGVPCTGVRDRRPERWGGKDDCFAPSAPKLKPKDACTVEALAMLVHHVAVLWWAVYPAPRTRC